MSNLVETEDVVCEQCEWLAVFKCECGELACGRHRAAHYPHHISEVQDPSAVTKGGKKK